MFLSRNLGVALFPPLYGSPLEPRLMEVRLDACNYAQNNLSYWWLIHSQPSFGALVMDEKSIMLGLSLRVRLVVQPSDYFSRLRYCPRNAKSRHGGGRGQGMIFPFQVLLNFLQEVLRSSVFSLGFKIIYFGAREEIFLAAWLNWTDSPVRRHDAFDFSRYLLLEVSFFSRRLLWKGLSKKEEGKRQQLH